MSAFFGLLLIIVIYGINHLNQKAKVDDNIDRMKAQGAFLPSSGERGKEIMDEIYKDWRDDRKLFPEEYWRYFEIREDARCDYIFALRGEKEIEEGYRPFFCGGGCYNKYTYFPMKNFHNNWDKKIEQSNKEMQEWRDNYFASFKDIGMFSSKESLF